MVSSVQTIKITMFKNLKLHTYIHGCPAAGELQLLAGELIRKATGPGFGPGGSCGAAGCVALPPYAPKYSAGTV